MTELEHAPLALEEFVLQVAPRFYVDNLRCADTWEELVDWRWNARPDEPIPVSGRFCEGTIWRAPRTNCAFRAWHDSIHLEFHQDFSLQGELKVAVIHQQRLGDHLDKVSRAWLWADTAGQNFHHVIHGDFPVDQKAFVNAVVRDGMASALGRKW